MSLLSESAPLAAMEILIEDLMVELVKEGGSDLHLAAGQPPYGRFNGQLRPMPLKPAA